MICADAVLLCWANIIFIYIYIPLLFCWIALEWFLNFVARWIISELEFRRLGFLLSFRRIWICVLALCWRSSLMMLLCYQQHNGHGSVVWSAYYISWATWEAFARCIVFLFNSFACGFFRDIKQHKERLFTFLLSLDSKFELKICSC